MKLPEESLLAKWVAAGGIDRLPEPWRMMPPDKTLCTRPEALIWIPDPGGGLYYRDPAYLGYPRALMLICDDAALCDSTLWDRMDHVEVHPGDATYPGAYCAAFARAAVWGNVAKVSYWRYKQSATTAAAIGAPMIYTPADEDAAERERQRAFFFGSRWHSGVRR